MNVVETDVSWDCGKVNKIKLSSATKFTQYGERRIKTNEHKSTKCIKSDYQLYFSVVTESPLPTLSPQLQE